MTLQTMFSVVKARCASYQLNCALALKDKNYPLAQYYLGKADEALNTLRDLVELKNNEPVKSRTTGKSQLSN